MIGSRYLICLILTILFVVRLSGQCIKLDLNIIGFGLRDTIYIGIHSILSEEKVDSIRFTDNSDLEIDKAYGDGSYVIQFDYKKKYYIYYIGIITDKINLEINPSYRSDCLLTRKYFTCDASRVNVMGADCTGYNYLISNYCSSSHERKISLNERSNFPIDYYDYLRSIQTRLLQTKTTLDKLNGKFILIKNTAKFSDESNPIVNLCDYIDTIYFENSNKSILINDRGIEEYAKYIGYSDAYVCDLNIVDFSQEKYANSCPSYWYFLLSYKDRLLKSDMNGFYIYQYKLKGSKLFLNYIEELSDLSDNEVMDLIFKKIKN